MKEYLSAIVDEDALIERLRKEVHLNVHRDFDRIVLQLVLFNFDWHHFLLKNLNCCCGYWMMPNLDQKAIGSFELLFTSKRSKTRSAVHC